MKEYDTLVLSGNSTNAIVTLGALQYLVDVNVLRNVKTFIGTSSGAIVSLLMMIGYQPLEILTYICVNKVYRSMVRFNISNMLLLGKPLMSFEPIKNCIDTLIIDKLGFVPTMKDLEKIHGKKIIFPTYNLTDERREYISSETHPNLSITNGIRMSSNFPLVFEPFIHEGKEYLDGGLVDNFAVEYASDMGGTCLGVMTNNQMKHVKESKGNLEFLCKIFQIFITTVTNDKISRTKCDIIPLNFPYNFFNFESTNLELMEMFDKGYDLCRNEFEKMNR